MSDVDLGLGISCQHIVELVTDYLEDALGPAARRQFEAHLGICADCVEYLRQLRITIETVGRVRLADLSDGRRRDLLAAFRDIAVD